MTIKEIDEKIEELLAKKSELAEIEKKKLAEEKDARKKEVDSAYEHYLKLVEKYCDDYGDYTYKKFFDFGF